MAESQDSAQESTENDPESISREPSPSPPTVAASTSRTASPIPTNQSQPSPTPTNQSESTGDLLTDLVNDIESGAVAASDDNRLHRYCNKGNIRKLERFIANLDHRPLLLKLLSRKGVFGYTPLHEAVAANRAQILGILLDKIREMDISQENPAHPLNCKANSGYTPLHLAASSGHEDCVLTLIEKGADIFKTDDYQKTPKQTAELGSKSTVVQILRSEGMSMCLLSESHDERNLSPSRATCQIVTELVIPLSF